MSSNALIVLMALTSFLLPGEALQAAEDGSAADLLLQDEVERAELLLDTQPRTAASVALRGEIEFRRGNFLKAESFYKEALRMDAAVARAHFGLGKLAMA